MLHVPEMTVYFVPNVTIYATIEAARREREREREREGEFSFRGGDTK